jgi:hypothetical protein
VNHVPDAALEAVDAFGEAWLHGDPPPTRAKLREDLRVELWVDGGDPRVRFETEHTRAPATLRERGSYVATIVDGLDDRLREWGFGPPAAYEYAGTVDGSHRYEGRLTPP